uniref:Golgi apparatus membrane protein TVP23 n=1 Tax=Mantoniella antarctica TaxID=81844 RepID=A0A7S0SVU1_9CHLO|mmetsp:Transcript_27521/g.43989  ORF Transcript_27521/g.43989 Transcript_27521/m.43989 type:complete len:187 (+) Transcript_27521:274-834(+)|eukprot:CAMPEP_0181364158 /NCGR_PEP_ID=MMETSP1106-20121128/9214_1 /TAXON_ID=81844 /ORGANISM="Mantoniella antarctica, Strain SL-175" /LENGTH=186 /DNA_ID=CAMNT_0023478807 /DNA_START=267 /DNA_END=827 /DNA_ORIENTATION=+
MAADQPSSPTGDGGGGSVSQTHPLAAACHVVFKILALVVYITCEWINSDFVLNFVTCVVLLAADFWTCKNVSGRLLVGLRYWNEIDDAGVSTWRFESRDAEGMKLVSPQESRLFWLTLYGAPAVWLGLGLIALARFSLDYLLIVFVALVLNMANVVGYTKCSKDARANISSFARTTIMSSIVHSMV